MSILFGLSILLAPIGIIAGMVIAAIRYEEKGYNDRWLNIVLGGLIGALAGWAWPFSVLFGVGWLIIIFIDPYIKKASS